MLYFLHLTMKPSRKKIKFPMLESKSVPPFGNATLAQDHALVAAAESFTNESPFFEGDSH